MFLCKDPHPTEVCSFIRKGLIIDSADEGYFPEINNFCTKENYSPCYFRNKETREQRVHKTFRQTDFSESIWVLVHLGSLTTLH